MLQRSKTSWIAELHMDYRALVITDIPLATIEWE